MSLQLDSSAHAISETGLKLIKAFEGYRPVDRELVTGQRVVGYGHRLYSDDAITMNKREAEAVLRSDLAPFEDMINSEVHAPLSQSQFDALCSFAFNIGPKAFLESDTIRALNNGRPLDAANGLDIWRKSEIAGKTYVVDALMRRRTAEKALFLRTERDLPAGRVDLPPVPDETVALLSTEDALPIFSADDANGVVATAPYDAAEAPFRRKDDGPAGVLELSELDALVEGEDIISDDLPWEDTELTSDMNLDLDDEVEAITPDLPPSPIAEAATGIVARLEALIEDEGQSTDDNADTADWPESLITAEVDMDEDIAPEIDFDLDTEEVDLADVSTLQPRKPIKPVAIIDELAQDDAFRTRSDSAAKYIRSTPVTAKTVEVEPASSGLGLWIPVLLGFALLGASAATMIRGSVALLGEWGPILAFSGFLLGIAMIMAGVYAALRMNLTRD